MTLASVSAPAPGDLERVLRGWEHAALWFSLGVGLLVIQTGAYLVPGMGVRDAFAAILVGSTLGAGLLAWVAWLGQTRGRSSAELMHAVFGDAFARLPVLLNVLQLIGWGTFEIVVMRDGTQAVLTHSMGVELGTVLPTLVWGVVVVLMIRTAMLTLVRRLIARIALPLVVLSLVWLTYQFGVMLDRGSLAALWQRAGDGSMNFFQGIDLIVAMPVSWLPVVADYARHGRGARATATGTWIGYLIANAWCYALGVLAVTAIGGDGGGVVNALLFAQGGLLALGFILVDELHNSYGDAYSASVSARSVWAFLDLRTWGTLIAVLCTVLAVLLPMHSLEPFLLLLSSIFVPLFGVILGWFFGRTRGEIQPIAVRWSAAAIWVAGIACFHGLGRWAPEYGSALPTIAATFVLALATARLAHAHAHARAPRWVKRESAHDPR